MWEDCWSELENNKLHDIKPQLGEVGVFYRTRRDQVVMTICRIEHSRLTHEYHLKKEPLVCSMRLPVYGETLSPRLCRFF